MKPTKEQVINKFLDNLKNDIWYHIDYYTGKKLTRVDKEHGINTFKVGFKIHNPFYIQSSKYRIQVSCSYWGLDIYRIDYDKWVDRDKYSITTQGYYNPGFRVNLTREEAYDLWRKICHRFDWKLGSIKK